LASLNSSERDRRRDAKRVRANLKVVVAHRDGEKQPATVIDVSTRGMHLRSERAPSYGEAVTVVVQLESAEWQLIPATVRWFSRRGFGVAFEAPSAAQRRALESFVAESAP
jgi:hypothetical protein